MTKKTIFKKNVLLKILSNTTPTLEPGPPPPLSNVAHQFSHIRHEFMLIIATVNS